MPSIFRFLPSARAAGTGRDGRPARPHFSIVPNGHANRLPLPAFRQPVPPHRIRHDRGPFWHSHRSEAWRMAGSSTPAKNRAAATAPATGAST